MISRINIDNRYPAEGEIRTNSSPYLEYAQCMIETFDSIPSFCDIGCATGHLIHYIKNFRKSIVKGYEYFDYHKKSQHCMEDIKDLIEIYDIRDELPDNIEQYEIVNCSEVGEHIDPAYADVLIENAKKLSSKYIMFTWSSHGGDLEPHCDPLHQHLNPLSNNEYMKLMKKHNLRPNIELTTKFLNASRNKSNFYFWWRESFVIWEKM